MKKYAVEKFPQRNFFGKTPRGMNEPIAHVFAQRSGKSGFFYSSRTLLANSWILRISVFSFGSL